MKLGAALFGALFCCLLAGNAWAQTAGVPPLAPAQSTFVDQNGFPIAGGKVYFYVPNTTTPKNTYQDSGLTTLNPNPVTLDSSGRALIYGTGAYREQVYDALGNLIWDQITVSAIPAGTPSPNTISTTNTTASTSTSTGAITDAGGLGVGGNINVGGFIANAPAVTWSGNRSAANTGIYSVGTWTGTASLSGQSPIYVTGYLAPLNLISVDSDNINASSFSGNTTSVDALTINHMFGGAAAVGSRTGLDINLELTAPTGNAGQSPANDFYNGLLVSSRADSNDGGTADSPNGYLGGISTQTTVACPGSAPGACATFFGTVHGAGEWDLQVSSGASVSNKIGAEISLVPNDAVQGSNIDAGFLFTDRGSTAWGYGIEFGLPVGQGGSFPVTGTVIGSYAGGSPTEGLDFSLVTATDCTIKAPNACLDGNGHLDFNNTTPSQTTTAACAGLGAGASCDLNTAGHSEDSAGAVVLNTGTSPSNAGTVTLTFGKSFNANNVSCFWTPHSGASTWPVPTMFYTTSASTSSASMVWNAGGTSLTASSSYVIDYFCVGR